MKVETRFNLFDRVEILPLDKLPGMVVGISIVSRCLDDILYVVEYWWEGRLNTVNLHSRELSVHGSTGTEPENLVYGNKWSDGLSFTDSIRAGKRIMDESIGLSAETHSDIPKREDL